MARILTIAELAAELKFCPKTTRKYVKQYKIPHAGFGRNMRFDLAEVWAHLKDLAIETSTDRVDLKAKKVSRRSAAPPATSRYSELLGLPGGH